MRQQGYTERQANRQDYAHGHWDDDDWDSDWDDDDLGEALVAGAVIAGTAAVVGAAVSTPSYTTYNYYNTLPCTPATVVSGGVTYYQCGATWYNQAYSGGSVTYVTVTPPPGY